VDAIRTHPPASADWRADNGAAFRAVITPGQSLDEKEHQFLLIFILGLSALFHAIYIALGLWIVAAILFVVTAGLVGMLLLFQKGQSRHESVTVENGTVRIARYRRGALVSETCLSQFALSIECERDPDYGLQHIRLRQRDVLVETGRDLSPAERAEYFEELRLAMVRHGLHPRVRTIVAASAP
jgi:uncharacterized membrane protein